MSEQECREIAFISFCLLNMPAVKTDHPLMWFGSLGQTNGNENIPNIPLKTKYRLTAITLRHIRWKSQVVLVGGMNEKSNYTGEL